MRCTHCQDAPYPLSPIPYPFNAALHNFLRRTTTPNSSLLTPHSSLLTFISTRNVTQKNPRPDH